MRLFPAIAGLFLTLMVLTPGTSGAVTIGAVPSNVDVGQTVTFSVSALLMSSPCSMFINFADGTTTNFTCISGATPNCGRTFSHTYAAPGNYNVSSGAVSGTCSGLPSPISTLVTVTAPCPSLGIISSDNLPDGTSGQFYSQQLFSNGGSTPVIWSLTPLNGNILPAGLTLTPTGMITGTPSASGTWNINITATDSCSTAQTVRKGIFLTINPAPCPPLSIISSNNLPNGTNGQFYSQQLLSSNGTVPVTWSLTPLNGNVLPAGLALTATGMITGTPSASGTWNINLTATDSCATPQTISRWFSLTVDPAPCTPLGMVTANLPQGETGQSYMLQIVTNGGVPPISFTLQSGVLPPGLSLNQAGLLSGVPATAGNFNFTVRGTGQCNVSPQTIDRNFTLVISESVPLCAPLNLTVPAGLTPLLVGQPFTTKFTASGGESPVTLALLSGSLPTGLNLTPNGVLAGSPSTAGSFTFTVRATDTCTAAPQRADGSLTLIVTEPSVTCPLLHIATPSQLTSGTVGQPYSGFLSTSGGQGAITFGLLSGALPQGVNLSTSGLLSGIPSEAGSFPLTIEASDSCTLASQNVSKTFTLVVNSVLPPTLSVSPPMISIQRRSPAIQTLTFSATSSGAMSGQLHSDQGVFLAGGIQIGVVTTPVTISLDGMTAMATETLEIPVAISRRAEESGFSRLTYRRVFHSDSINVPVELDILLATGATADFKITRLELSFDNGRAETTVKRNQMNLKLAAKMQFLGSGLLQGYWEVDGRILAQVNQHLVFGRSVTLTTPDTPSLPTFREGSHRVRLVITTPVIDLTLPEAIYFVTAEESAKGIRSLRLLQPGHLAQVPYGPVSFSWEGHPGVMMSLIEILEQLGESPVASAYTKNTYYLLPEPILRESLTPGKSYLWKVTGFDLDGKQVVESPTFRFTPE